MTTVANKLADFVCNIQSDSIPKSVRKRVQTCLLYNIGLMVSSHSIDQPIIIHFLNEFKNIHGKSTIVNSAFNTTAENAAFLNAAITTSRGQNDTHPLAGSHLGCVVIPVTLALGEELESSGEEVLAAILAGYEVIARIGSVMCEKVSERGFRPTALFGLYGSVAAAAKLYKLDRDSTAHAFSIATNISGGLLQTWQEGSMEWQWQIALAAKNGLLASKLAHYGVIGSKRAFEGEAGFFRAYTGENNQTIDTKTDHWEIEEVTFKPLPGCAINQTPVQLLLRLIEEYNIVADSVESIDLYLTPREANYPGTSEYGPFLSRSGAIMSAPFMLTVALNNGTIKYKDYGFFMDGNPIHENSYRVKVKEDQSLTKGQCVIEIHTTGQSLRVENKTDKEFIYKWTETIKLAKHLFREAEVENENKLIDTIQNLSKLASIRELTSILP